MLSGTAVAWADRGPSDSTGPSSEDSAGATASTPATNTPRHGARVPRTAPAADADTAPKTRRSAADAIVDATPEPAAAVVVDTPQRGRGADNGRPTAAPRQTDSAPTTPAATSPIAAELKAEPPAPDASAVPAPAAALAPAAAVLTPAIVEPVKASAPAAISASVAPTVGVPTVLATVADRIAAAISQLAQTFGNSPFAPPTESPANWLLLAAARRQPAAAAVTAAATGTSVGPTLLVLNGYNVVAASQKLVTSFYGPFVNFPAYPGTQSEQKFNLVDPGTSKVVGSFKALQSTFTAVGTTRQLVVTDVLSGTTDGVVPPVGSVISSSLNFGFGTLYTATPSPSGNVVSFKFVTPFGSIPLPFPYDAAKGLTDYAVVNQPLILPGDGYSIAPTRPSTEKFTAVTGLQPLFTAIQGTQDYSVYDRNGVAVGDFAGLVTTTSDALGLYTKEIRVTSVGESADPKVPPVGTVYNIINFSDKYYVLYSSAPSETGTVTSTRLVTPLGAVTIPLNFDAATAPVQKPLQVPGGYKFVPVSDSPVIGVNGLPPREMITQGYQQFDVVDILGNKIGSVNADVTRQWDWFGGSSEAILITKVTSGTAGPLPWNVPPVGSVFNARQPYGINLGFSDYYSSIPTLLGDLVTYGLVTPFGFIPMFLPNYLSAELNDAAFVDPFAHTA